MIRENWTVVGVTVACSLCMWGVNLRPDHWAKTSVKADVGLTIAIEREIEEHRLETGHLADVVETEFGFAPYGLL